MYRYRPPCYHATTTVLIPRPYIGQQSILLPLLLHHAIMQHPASSAVGGGSNFRFGTAWDTCVSFETLETPLGHMCLIWDTLGTLWDTSWDTCLNDRQNFTNRVSCWSLHIKVKAMGYRQRTTLTLTVGQQHLLHENEKWLPLSIFLRGGRREDTQIAVYSFTFNALAIEVS